MRTAPANLRWIYALGLLGLLFFAADRLVFESGAATSGAAALRATRLMAEALEALKPCAAARGVVIDPSTDLNRTALIGLEESPITTSLGQLEAKRTSANPNFAGCLVRMLDEAGVRSGDAVAVGASSSFPGMILATIAAALIALAVYKAMAAYFLLYGRRRFVLMLLLGALFGQLWLLIWPRLAPPSLDLRVVGWIIPGLLANNLERQKILPTLAALAAVTVLTYVIARIVGML